MLQSTLGGALRTPNMERRMRRWPWGASTALCLELALVVAGTGAAPAALWRVLAIPGYMVHLALSQLLPGGFFAYAAVFIAGGIAVDVIRWRTA